MQSRLSHTGRSWAAAAVAGLVALASAAAGADDAAPTATAPATGPAVARAEREVLFEAARRHIADGHFGAAHALLEELAERYPGTPEGREAAWLLTGIPGGVHGIVGAEKALVTFASLYPDDPRAAAALLEAASIREALGDLDAAIGHMTELVKRFGARDPAEAAHHLFLRAGLRDRAGDPEGAASDYRDYLKRHGWRRSLEEAARAELFLAKWVASPKKRAAALERIVRTWERLPSAAALPPAAPPPDLAAAREPVAEAAFLRAELAREGSSVGAPPPAVAADPVRHGAALERWLGARKEALDRARRAYEKVVALDAMPWRLAALFRIGELYWTFSKEIARLKRAAGTEAYRPLISDLTEPLRERAEGAFVACLHLAREREWPGEWASACEAALHEMDPGRWPLVEEIVPPPRVRWLPVGPAPIDSVY